MLRLVLVGGGGHASEILGALEAIDRLLPPGKFNEIAGMVADGEIDMRRFQGRMIRQIGQIDDLPKLDVSHFIAAVGYPEGRKRVADRVETFGLAPYSVVHPEAWVPEGTSVGQGSVILARACIGVGVSIGRHVSIGAASVVGHDCRISDFASVMPGAAISGDTELSEGCLVGTNSAVLEKRIIGAWAKVGAGAVVTRDIPDNATAMGVPARFR